MIHKINQPVDIIAACTSHNHRLTPKIMYWQNRRYNFTRLGYRHPTSKGRRMIHVFDMSDESHAYRLEFDAESLQWHLQYISDGMP